MEASGLDLIDVAIKHAAFSLTPLSPKTPVILLVQFSTVWFIWAPAHV